MLKKNKGFTIVEILVAFALLGAGLTGVVLIMSEGQSQNTLSKKYEIAMGLAKEQMEIIRNSAYADISTGPRTIAAPYDVDYSCQANVTLDPLSPTTSAQIKDVVVIVTYPAGKNETATVSLETFIANY